MNTVTRLKLGSRTAIALLSLSMGAMAGDADQELNALADMSLEDLMKVQVPTVYGASKHEQKVTEAPSDVTVVTAEEIQRRGARTLGEALDGVRGLYVTSDRTYSYLGVRGFNRPGDFNSRTLVLVDGQRINDNIYNSGFIGTEFPVDVDLIERVEVIRGPGSALYGNNAFFGVINLVTKRGRDLKAAEASVEAGSFDSYRGRATYGNQFKNEVEILLSGSIYDSGGRDRLYYPEYDSPATNDGFAERADGDSYKNGFAKLSYKDFTLEGSFHNREKHIPTGAFGTVFNDPTTKAVDERGFVRLKFDREFGDDWAVVAAIAYDHYRYLGDYFSDYGPELGPPDLQINRDVGIGRWWETEFQVRKTFNERLSLMSGFEYRQDITQRQENFNIPSDESFIDYSAQNYNWGVFTQGELNILTNLTLTAGVRYDRYDTFGGTVNPRAGLIGKPFKDTVIKAMYGTAFRGPNAFELYYHDAGTAKANPDLDAETIRTYELAVDQYFGPRLRASVSGFFYQTENLINQVTDPADGLIVFENLDKSEAIGVEMELESNWENGLSARASFTLQDATDSVTGNRLDNSPRHLAKLYLSVPLAPKRLYLTPSLRYLGSRETLAGNRVDSYWLADLNLLATDYPKGWDFSVGVYNLAGTRHYHLGGTEHMQDMLEMDGTSFRVKVTRRF